MRLSYSLREKENIVNEAYSGEKSVAATARKYGVERHSIRNWKKTLLNFSDAKNKGCGPWTHCKSLKKIRPPSDPDVLIELRKFMDKEIKEGRNVTYQILTDKFKAIYKGPPLSNLAIYGRLRRFDYLCFISAII